MNQLDKLSDFLKLLGDTTRLTIFAMLKEKELCVCEIVESLQTSQPNVSQHIRKLKDGGLVKETKKGRWVYYSWNIQDKPVLLDIVKYIPSRGDLIDQATCEINECCI